MKTKYKLTLNNLSELVNTDIYNVIYEYWKNCYHCGISKTGRIFMNNDKLTCTGCLVKNYIQKTSGHKCCRYTIDNNKYPKNYADVICHSNWVHDTDLRYNNSSVYHYKYHSTIFHGWNFYSFVNRITIIEKKIPYKYNS